MKGMVVQCDVCQEENVYVPIIKKPLRFLFKERLYDLPQINDRGEKKDNICLSCLREEIESLENVY